MSWALRAQSATATGTTSLVLDCPAGATTNDMLVACFVHNGSVYATLPAGWTSVIQQISGTHRTEVATIRAGASEPATYTFSALTAADTALGIILDYTGGTTSGTFVNISTSRANLANAEGCLSITTTVANTLLLAVMGTSDDVSTGTNYLIQGPNGIGSLTMLTRTNTTSAVGSDCSLGVCELGFAGIAPTGAVLGGTNIAVTNVCALLAFIPATSVVSTATRFYATSRSYGVRMLGLPTGTYPEARPQNRGVHHWPFVADQSKDNGGPVATSTFGFGCLNTVSEKQYTERFLIGPLAAQTISGTLDLCFQVAIGAGGGAAGAYYVHAYVTQGATYLSRNVLASNVTDSTAWTSTSTWRQLGTPIVLTSRSALAGDFVCVEVGAVTSPPTAPPGDSAYTMGWGTTNNANVPVADATNGSTTSQLAAWINITNALTLQNPSVTAPANNACGTATTISSLPHSETVRTDVSTGYARSVWWTYTPAATGRVFVSTLGGNYSTKVQVWSGSCGSLSLVNTSFDLNAAQGNSQSIAWVDLTASTQYWIQVSQPGQTGRAPYDPPSGGGSLTLTVVDYSAPANDDVYANGQHILALRNGAIVNFTEDYYGQAPSGTAVDYSGFTITDQNGGTHSGERLIVGMFLDGSVGNTIQFLDLPTLNLGESAVNTQNDLDAGGAAYTTSEKIQSIYVDATTSPPRLVTGWDGDDFTWIGSSSSAAAMQIRRTPTSNNFDPGPQTIAEAFTVTQDVMGSCYLDVIPNGSIAFYTSAGTLVLRYDMDADVQLANFSTVANAVGPRPGLRMLRLLDPYDGTGGLIVTNGTTIVRLDGAGAVVQTYTPAQSSYFQDIDKLAITSDALSFVFGDALSMALGTFQISSGAQTAFWETDLPPGHLSGITNYGFRGTPIIFPDFDIVEDPIRWLRRAPIQSSENRRIFHKMFVLDVETGVGLPSGLDEDTDPQVMMRYSDDSGRTYGNELWRSLGRVGKFLTRLEWWRLGAPRNRVYEVSGSAAVKIVLIDGYVDAEGSTDSPES